MTDEMREPVDAADVVLRLRDRTDLTLDEIGEVVGMSAEWCRQVELEARDEMRWAVTVELSDGTTRAYNEIDGQTPNQIIAAIQSRADFDPEDVDGIDVHIRQE